MTITHLAVSAAPAVEGKIDSTDWNAAHVIADGTITLAQLATAVQDLIDANKTRVISALVTDPGGSAITTGDGKIYIRIPSILNGYNLSAVAAYVSTASTSGLPTVQIRNVTDSQDMLSTKLTIDANEKDSKDAATPAVINASYDDVATADILAIDIDVAGTGTKGLIVEMTFTLP